METLHTFQINISNLLDCFFVFFLCARRRSSSSSGENLINGSIAAAARIISAPQSFRRIDDDAQCFETIPWLLTTRSNGHQNDAVLTVY